jgi:hypothetical protein
MEEETRCKQRQPERDILIALVAGVIGIGVGIVLMS